MYLSVSQYFTVFIILTILLNCVVLALEDPVPGVE